MKILLAFLITFLIQAVPTHVEIDAMTIDTELSQLLFRMEFSTTTCSYLEGDPEILSDYDRMYDCNPSKPSTIELSNELISYQTELHAARAAQLIEMARVQDIRDRLKALKHKKKSIRESIAVANPMAWIRDNINSMDKVLMEAKIVSIEAKDVVLEKAYQTRKTEKNTDRIEFDNLKTFFKGYACNTLGDFNSRVCRSLKLKYNKR